MRSWACTRPTGEADRRRKRRGRSRWSPRATEAPAKRRKVPAEDQKDHEADPTGKAIAKLGDFDGLSMSGAPRGLLFPASPDFSRDGNFLYVTNLGLDIRLFGLAPSVDSQWTAQLQR